MRAIKWASNLVGFALLSATLASTAFADDLIQPVVDLFSNDGEAFDLSDSLLGDESAYDFGGWIAAGGSSNSTGLFNSYNGFQLTQGWLYAEKGLDTADGFDWGFRGDVMVGVDHAATNSFGNNVGVYDFGSGTSFGDSGLYGLAAPQLYVELGYKDFQIKGGKFYTPVGYEVVTAPDNFFFSHAFTMFNSEPFTHTGALATWSGIDNVDIMVGWSAGWDTGFDQINGGSNFIGGVSLALTENTSLTYTTTAGNLGWLGDDGYTHSFVLDTMVTENLNYVIQSDYTDVKSNGAQASKTVGVNQYLFYSINDFVSVGTRVEWWRSEDVTTGQDVDTYATTFGANFQLLPNLRARPEYRYQFSQVNPSAPADEAGIFGIDFILTY